MTNRVGLVVVVAVLGGLVRPAPAEACSCGGAASSPVAFHGADLVFVGTVVRVDGPTLWSRAKPDGTITAGITTDPPVTTFQIAHMFRGRGADQIAVVGDSTDCNVSFKLGEVWLVYARLRNGQIVTDQCTRTRLRAEAEASQDLEYLDAVEAGRPQGVVSGSVLHRITLPDGQPALQAPLERLQVIAVGRGSPVRITTDLWGPYQLVLPPGDYDISVERAGRAVATPQSIHVEAGSDRHLMLMADYKD